MKTCFSFILFLSAFAVSCSRVPEAPIPGEPGYYECSDCMELIRGPFLRVVPSGDGNVSVWHTGTKKCILADISPEWDKISADQGPDILFRGKDGKYGFFDSLNGELIIPPVHRRAWPFNEGLCAVEDNGEVRFRDERGEPVFGNRVFPYYGHPLDYFVFRNGGCPVPDKNLKCGVINKDGKWMIPPEYKDIVYLDDCILALGEGRRIQYGFDGKVMNPFVVDGVCPILFKNKETGLFLYEVEERYGLMDGEGAPLTAALYRGIEPISETLLQAWLADEFSRVILDRKGKIHY